MVFVGFLSKYHIRNRTQTEFKGDAIRKRKKRAEGLKSARTAQSPAVIGICYVADIFVAEDAPFSFFFSFFSLFSFFFFGDEATLPPKTLGPPLLPWLFFSFPLLPFLHPHIYFFPRSHSLFFIFSHCCPAPTAPNHLLCSGRNAPIARNFWNALELFVFPTWRSVPFVNSHINRVIALTSRNLSTRFRVVNHSFPQVSLVSPSFTEFYRVSHFGRNNHRQWRVDPMK